MSEEQKRESVSTLKGTVPKWGDYFEKRLEFKLSKDNVTSLVTRLNINCKNENTVFKPAGRKASGIIEPERKPTTVFFIIFEPHRFLKINAVNP